MEKEMDEGRKRTLGVIHAIFACRKLAVLEGKPSPAREMAFRDSIDLAVKMMLGHLQDYGSSHPVLSDVFYVVSQKLNNVVITVESTRDVIGRVGGDQKEVNLVCQPIGVADHQVPFGWPGMRTVPSGAFSLVALLSSSSISSINFLTRGIPRRRSLWICSSITLTTSRNASFCDLRNVRISPHTLPPIISAPASVAARIASAAASSQIPIAFMAAQANTAPWRPSAAP